MNGNPWHFMELFYMLGVCFYGRYCGNRAFKMGLKERVIDKMRMPLRLANLGFSRLMRALSLL